MMGLEAHRLACAEKWWIWPRIICRLARLKLDGSGRTPLRRAMDEDEDLSLTPCGGSTPAALQARAMAPHSQRTAPEPFDSSLVDRLTLQKLWEQVSDLISNSNSSCKVKPVWKRTDTEHPDLNKGMMWKLFPLYSHSCTSGYDSVLLYFGLYNEMLKFYLIVCVSRSHSTLWRWALVLWRLCLLVNKESWGWIRQSDSQNKPYNPDSLLVPVCFCLPAEPAGMIERWTAVLTSLTSLRPWISS